MFGNCRFETDPAKEATFFFLIIKYCDKISLKMKVWQIGVLEKEDFVYVLFESVRIHFH
jgi:hypothetical protein